MTRVKPRTTVKPETKPVNPKTIDKLATTEQKKVKIIQPHEQNIINQLEDTRKRQLHDFGYTAPKYNISVGDTINNLNKKHGLSI